LSVPRSNSPTRGASRQRDPWSVHAQTVGGIVDGPQSGTLRRGFRKATEKRAGHRGDDDPGRCKACFPPPPRSPPSARLAHSRGGPTLERGRPAPARARAGRDGRGETSVRTGRRRHEAYPMGAWAIRLWAHDRSCPISALYERLVRARGSLVTRPLVIASAQIGSRPRPLAEQMLGEWPLYGHRTLVVLRNVGNISSGGAVGLGKRRWREGLPGHGSGPASPCRCLASVADV
jgi:hypothetical protein